MISAENTIILKEMITKIHNIPRYHYNNIPNSINIDLGVVTVMHIPIIFNKEEIRHMIKNIVKRDGRTMVFEPLKITNAILAAMKKCEVVDTKVATKIADKIANLKVETVEIEKVQDIIEIELMKTKYKNVAKEFITYRNARTQTRRRSSKLNKQIEDIIMGNVNDNSNANIDDKSFSGRKNESANALHKDIALNVIIRPEVAQAHKESRIYIHDLSEYNIGSSNCLFIDMAKVLKEGFETRNGDVRPANSFSTACQLFAVVCQCNSQTLFGGVASMHIDYDLAPYVKKSFIKHYKTGLTYVDTRKAKDFINFLEDISKRNNNDANYAISLVNAARINDVLFKKYSPSAYEYAIAMLEKEGLQSAQGLYHNLNTLESRAGSQVPFTSINFGRDTSPEGRKVSEWMMKASLGGIGKYNSTPIFPISILVHKKGVNDKPGTPNYDLKKLAIESLSSRIYPNIINSDWSQNVESSDDPDSHMACMGCRTLVGRDRHGLEYKKAGRGNVSPVTINLAKLGIKHGICLGERTKPDIEGFWEEFKEVLKLTETALVDRFYYICKQSVKAAAFMYKNGTIADSEQANIKGIYEAMRHGTNAFGFIGVAEMCKALFGIDHSYGNKEVDDFAESVVKYISDYAKECSEKHDLNFSCYSSPAESLCKTYSEALNKEFGNIKDITDRGYLTNSFHVPVWRKVSIYDKLRIESKYCRYSLGGCITYIELEAKVMNNPQAIEDIINYAMDLDIPYLAFNFPIDTCKKCGYSGEIENNCPKCSSTLISRLRRVTGYLSSSMEQFNEGKIKEVLDRQKHSKYTSFNEE